MVLDEQKMQCITYLLAGEQITDIAKLINCSRTSIYNWLEDEDFKAEMDRRVHEMSSAGNKKILADVTTYIDKLKLLALKGKSEKVQLAAAEYLLDRIYGRPTSKVDIDDNDNKDKDNINLDTINEAMDEVDNNVISLKPNKA